MAENSHGRIGVAGMRRTLTSTHDLAQVPTLELAAELTHRLVSPLGAATYNASMLQCDVLDELCRAIPPAIDVYSNRFSLVAAAGMLTFPRHCHERFGLPLHGAHHVDMGCGSLNPFGRMFTHLMAGAGRATCMELDRPEDLAKAVRHLAFLASVALVDPMRLFPGTAITRQQILDHLADFDLARLAKGDPGGLSPRLQFVQRSICDTGFADGSVDVTFSNSVLEHLPDIDQFLTECARITRPGGFGVHGIDVADHRRYSNPSIHALEFLTEERTDPILHECNRLRLGDHERKFAEHGFEILTTRRDPPIDLPADLRARFVEPWRSLPDDQLNVIWCQYLVRRR